jgi:hypothetical protein
MDASTDLTLQLSAPVASTWLGGDFTIMAQNMRAHSRKLAHKDADATPVWTSPFSTEAR